MRIESAKIKLSPHKANLTIIPSEGKSLATEIGTQPIFGDYPMLQLKSSTGSVVTWRETSYP